MKIPVKLWIFGALFTLLIVGAAPYQSDSQTTVPISPDQTISMPDNVMAIVEAKCMGCHKPDAKNEKARAKLQWVLLPEMEVEELVGKLDDILEVLEEGSMPPQGVLEKYPNMKLTDEETQILKEWAESNANRLLGDD